MTKIRMFMRTMLLIFVGFIMIGFYSCEQKTLYGTSITIENGLNDSIYLILYPKETPYSPMTNYKMKESETEMIHGVLGHDGTPTDLLKAAFDSIVIRYNKHLMLFSADTVIGYKTNLFTDIELWDSELVEYNTPDNFNRNPHEDVAYRSVLSVDMLGEE